MANTKVVVRNLPYNLTLEEFQEAAKDSWPAVTWHCYSQGHKTSKKEISSRAFLNFKSGSEVVRFHTSFDGHVFLDNRGREHKCTVEYAPYQRIPSKQPKKDRNEGTIEVDEDYQKFLLELNQPAQYLPSAEAQYEERLAAEKTAKDPSSTPILEELRQRAAAATSPQNRTKRGGKRANATKKQQQKQKQQKQPPKEPQTPAQLAQAQPKVLQIATPDRSKGNKAPTPPQQQQQQQGQQQQGQPTGNAPATKQGSEGGSRGRGRGRGNAKRGGGEGRGGRTNTNTSTAYPK